MKYESCIFDAKPYDKPGFDRYAQEAGIEIKYFETHLNEDTVSLAAGYDCVCVFVNDTVNAAVAEKLYQGGTRMIALRCAGFNNVGHPCLLRQNSCVPGTGLLPPRRGRVRHGPCC